ncbi:MAG: methyltransferase domain-containing protein [candidate division Zixibacteria bacterium]|nr:methyltransferase domain-containing protein [candidate division Zixibacteria bacterium]
MLSKLEKEYIDTRGYWTLFKPLALFYRHQLERALTRALRREGVALEGKRLLEDGCERGNLLRQLLELGASPGRCVGLDRDDAALRDGRDKTAAALRFVCGDAAALPFRSGAFDVVVQSLLFSSLPPGEARERAAAEMERVLAGGGVLVWYDFVERAKEGLPQGLELGEVRELFPGWRLAAYKFGLRFRWAHFLVNKCLWLAQTLASLGVARSHYVIIIRRP